MLLRARAEAGARTPAGLSPGIARALAAAALISVVSAVAAVTVSCGPRATHEQRKPEFRILCEVRPEAHVVGPATAEIHIEDSSGHAVSGAAVDIEANMTHPGMVPVTASAHEGVAGHYQADFSFTMAGDWTVEVRARLDNGRRIESVFPIAGVARSAAPGPGPGQGSGP